VADLIADIVDFLRTKQSLEAYQKTFAAIDQSGQGLVEAEDFRWCLIDLGYNLTKDHAEQLCAHFGSDQINYI